MKTVMASTAELMINYRETPYRTMRAASVSTDSTGAFYSYGLKIAQFSHMPHRMFRILHDPATSVTTKRHISDLSYVLRHSPYRFVPHLDASEEEITEYYTALLNRIEQRFSRSKNLNTAREYFITRFECSKHANNLPPMPAKIQLFAELEGWGVDE